MIWCTTSWRRKRLPWWAFPTSARPAATAAYRRFKEAGYTVYAVNPHLTTFDGEPCYPDLNSIPEKPDAVFILANPKVTDQIVQQCVDLGIKHVWMHCMMGTKPGLAAGMTSVSQDAVRMCRENGIAVIPGSCPNQFLQARLRSHDDADDVAHDRLHEDQPGIAPQEAGA